MSGFRYYGQFYKGQRSGQGIAHFPNGNVVKGEWYSSKINGQATLYNKDRDKICEGIFKDDYLVKGTYWHKSGTRYIGEFIKTKRHGEGQLITSDGTVLNYKYNRGVLLRGAKKYKNSLYEGELNRNFQAHGHGVKTYFSG
jgi:hypothetical protein